MCVYKSAYNYTIKLGNCATHAISYHHKVGRITIKLLFPDLIPVESPSSLQKPSSNYRCTIYTQYNMTCAYNKIRTMVNRDSESASRSTTISGPVSVPPNWLIADPHWNTQDS